jgi:peptidyl-tRNA hydrolase
MSDKPRYLKQIIVMRRNLNQPSAKMAAMAAHASMTFLLDIFGRMFIDSFASSPPLPAMSYFTAEQLQWLTELDPGLEAIGQKSMAKIVLFVADEAELVAIETKAKEANLVCHRVVDSGYSHNPAGTFVCIAIGPDWPEKLDPITGHLKTR